MLSVDLNCDLGEGCANDAELMKLITSANIACGSHAGDIDTMRRTVELAAANSVAIGAHPSYADKENFGRTPMDLSPTEISDLVSEQILLLRSICDEFGAKLVHVKPHGALYNQAAVERGIADAIADAIVSIDPNLLLFGLSGSQLIEAAETRGLLALSEVFADRTYRPDATLTPRSEPNALITKAEVAVNQVLNIVKYGRVRTSDATMAAIRAETVCIHGDGVHAIEFAVKLRSSLKEAGIEIQNPIRAN